MFTKGNLIKNWPGFLLVALQTVHIIANSPSQKPALRNQVGLGLFPLKPYALMAWR